MRVKEESQIDYSMKIEHLRIGELTLNLVLFSKTLIALYPALLVLIFITYKIRQQIW